MRGSWADDDSGIPAAACSWALRVAARSHWAQPSGCSPGAGHRKQSYLPVQPPTRASLACCLLPIARVCRWATPFSHLVSYVRKHLVEMGAYRDPPGSGPPRPEAGAAGAEDDDNDDDGPTKSTEDVYVWWGPWGLSGWPSPDWGWAGCNLPLPLRPPSYVQAYC